MQPEALHPSSRNAALSFHATYFPMGFPLHLATDFRAALTCAGRMWSRFPQVFDRAPAQVRIRVSGGRAPAALPPAYRSEEHLFSIAADRDNFAVADLASGSGTICVSRDIAGDPASLRYHFLEPLAYVLIAARHAAFVHASCVALDGRAALLCGPSGAGKTCLAYACARRGWTFVSGDAVAVLAPGDRRHIAGRPFDLRFRHTAAKLFPELSRFPPVLRPSGKTDIEVDSGALNLPHAVPGTAHRIVLLDRSSDAAAPAVEPVSPADARCLLHQGICFGGEAVRTLHARTLDSLAQAPAVRLRYSDPYAAEPVLRALMQRGD